MQDTFKEVAVMIIAASILFLVLAGVVLFIILFYQKKRFQHQGQMILLESSFRQELLKSQLETQELTFRQIGGELHDNVAQLLTTAKIQLGILDQSLKGSYPTLGLSMDILSRALEELRSLSKSLNREWLEQFDLLENLRQEIMRINAGRTVSITMESRLEELPFSVDKQIMLFRIIQEALQNAIKHASAKNIHVSFIPAKEGLLSICVSDDGKGFNLLPQDRKTGVGVINMEHRTRLLGGAIHWQAATPHGTNVMISLNLQNIQS